MSNRNPLVNPKPGDVVRLHEHQRRVDGVPMVKRRWVTYTVEGLGGLRSEPLKHWRRVMKQGEVIHRAD